MTKSHSFQSINRIATERGHVLISMENYQNVKSFITLFCKTCSTEWTPKLHSYLNAKKTGCPNCKRIVTSQTHSGKKLSEETKRLIGEKASQRPGSLRGVTGENHPCYKHGIGRDFETKNTSTKDNCWRNGVRFLYQNKCIITGKTNTKKFPLVCHHLYAYNKYPDLRYDATNGVYISKEIHAQFHALYGSGNNTESQWEEFCKEKLNMDWNKTKNQYFVTFIQSPKFHSWQSAAYLSEKDFASLAKLEESGFRD